MTEMPESQPNATRCDEFQVGAATVTMISDVENERAWIQSTQAVTIEP